MEESARKGSLSAAVLLQLIWRFIGELLSGGFLLAGPSGYPGIAGTKYPLVEIQRTLLGSRRKSVSNLGINPSKKYPTQ